MKKTFYLALMPLIFSGITLQSQTSGTVVYEQSIKIEINLEGQYAQFADMIPRERKSKKELIFNEKASLYQNLPEVSNSDVINESGARGNFMMRMPTMNDIMYIDLENNKRVEQKEFFDRNFLIEYDDDDTKWKITGNRKEILGYECMEAESVKNDEKITVWFTPLIPISAGPSNFAGLPGLVLAVETNSGKNVITAISVDLKPIPEKDIKKPNKGRKVTSEEYKKIVEEKMEEMGVQPGGGATRMIIRH